MGVPRETETGTSTETKQPLWEEWVVYYVVDVPRTVRYKGLIIHIPGLSSENCQDTETKEETFH